MLLCRNEPIDLVFNNPFHISNGTSSYSNSYPFLYLTLKDVSEFFHQQALDKLQELGYDALFDWEAREKLKEGK